MITLVVLYKSVSCFWCQFWGCKNKSYIFKFHRLLVLYVAEEFTVLAKTSRLTFIYGLRWTTIFATQTDPFSTNAKDRLSSVKHLAEDQHQYELRFARLTFHRLSWTFCLPNELQLVLGYLNVSQVNAGGKPLAAWW